MGVLSQISPADALDSVVASAAVQSLLASFARRGEEITREQIRICSIPAPPFGESVRAAYMRQRFTELELQDVKLDAEGNCLGWWRGSEATPLVVLSAHLDTVFGAETDCTVRRIGERLYGPGIADNGAGLAALIAIADGLRMSRLRTHGSILFAATVGEEGEGNLRGVKHLFSTGELSQRVEAFISFDGAGVEGITNAALTSRRYRVRVTGPGGHSWADFGIPNPVHALGRAVAQLVAYPAPDEPRTSYNVGRIAGGTGVNAIPQNAEMAVDLRSVSQVELLRLDAFFRRGVQAAVDQENAQRQAGAAALSLELTLTGQRPAGETAPGSRLVQLAASATRMVGHEPRLEVSSTDANLPMSLGIPAVTLGGGGRSGLSHTPDEWYDPTDREIGLRRAALVTLALVGLG